MHQSNTRMLLVALAVCLSCSIVVSTASVGLRGLQAANQLLDKQRNILSAAGLLSDGASATEIRQAFEHIETRLVDLESGYFVPHRSEIAEQLSDYDVRTVSRDERFSKVLDADTDIAGLKRRERYAQIYLVREQNQFKSIVLPVRGYGLWSTLYGFIALESNFNTVTGLAFYQHGETPGLGGEVDNPQWKQRWRGKQIYRNNAINENIAISVTKKPPQQSSAIHHVDGLSGATITTRGVHQMMRYWFGEHGFGPFLKNLNTTNLN